MISCRHLHEPATPTSLRLAPQLAVLAVLDEALLSAACMLIAQHPHLVVARSALNSVPYHFTARRLHDCLAHCSYVLADYRTAVATTIADLAEPSIAAQDDIPF